MNVNEPYFAVPCLEGLLDNLEGKRTHHIVRSSTSRVQHYI